MRLGVDDKQADQIIRGSIVLPHGIGKSKTVVVFAKGAAADQATEAGADLTQDSFAAAIERLGPIDLPGFPFASLGPDKFDADDSFRLAVFDATLGEEGELAPLTEISNAASS